MVNNCFAFCSLHNEKGDQTAKRSPNRDPVGHILMTWKDVIVHCADNKCEPSAFSIEEAADKESNGSSDSETTSKNGAQESG